MEDGSVESWCISCGRPTNDVGTGIERQPCPKCGTMGRKAIVIARVSIGVGAGYIVKGFSETKRPKKLGKARKPFFEEKDVDEIYREEGKVYRVFRMFDYLKNLYQEKISDKASGAVVREISEPLSEHRGHGSDRRRS